MILDNFNYVQMVVQKAPALFSMRKGKTFHLTLLTEIMRSTMLLGCPLPSVRSVNLKQNKLD